MADIVNDILRRRREHIAPGLSVLYSDDPIHVVRAAGQYLYDDSGAAYLDCMNNVPHVGHCHPRVADAVARQFATLNTNSRLLYDQLAEYAERLCALVPDPLEVCYFVNSGSEANELALRLMRAATGRRGVVALSGAYHGNTTSLVDISPYKFDGRGGQGRPRHVQVAPAPDAYRGPHRDEGAVESYTQEVDDALRRGERDGFAAGAFISEALMGTAGQIHPPEGYLPGAYARARDHGALVIADEVQVGFGRVGQEFWAFRAMGATPDILTLGKPIGNSYPLGAVITTREIAAEFDNGMEYFNTFGGSPVACAAGLAVLDVLRDEELPEHAEKVGDHLLSRLRELGETHEAIGDVRGLGLFIGVEIVADRATRTPASDVARHIVTRLRAERILISTDGPDDNVLKIKPPLAFDADDADRLADAIHRALIAME
ncbi:aminotransferase class III-fold pyridoxal phosphate-dependent enzyme [Nocardioidaceae bacterium SCSIO 66511]|nr:aminotransferase class III-fold pyridoxal phosphate-dependent enzyme [Nocardioidaceae bacterium SCSIO 66511]